jgi:hypothetical protein
MAQTATGKKEEEFDVEVEVPLRLTVSQPVRLGIEPLPRSHDLILLINSNHYRIFPAKYLFQNWVL